MKIKYLPILVAISLTGCNSSENGGPGGSDDEFPSSSTVTIYYDLDNGSGENNEVTRIEGAGFKFQVNGNYGYISSNAMSGEEYIPIYDKWGNFIEKTLFSWDLGHTSNQNRFTLNSQSYYLSGMALPTKSSSVSLDLFERSHEFTFNSDTLSFTTNNGCHYDGAVKIVNNAYINDPAISGVSHVHLGAFTFESSWSNCEPIVGMIHYAQTFIGDFLFESLDFEGYGDGVIQRLESDF